MDISGYASHRDEREKLAPHRVLTFEDRGLEALERANAAAASGDVLTMKVEMGKARLLLRDDVIDRLIDQHGLRSLAFGEGDLVDPRFQAVSSKRVRMGLADIR